jgi:hypothetical protein
VFILQVALVAIKLLPALWPQLVLCWLLLNVGYSDRRFEIKL